MLKKTDLLFRKIITFLHNSPIAAILFLEVIFGISITLISFIAFIHISNEIFEKDFMILDTHILQFFYLLRTPLLTTIMIIISYFGGEIIVGLGILVTILLLIKKHKREAFLFSFIVIMAIIIDNVVKNIVQRTRPQFHPLIIEKDYSFPSGHAMDSFVFYMMLSYLLFHFTKNKKLATLASTCSIFLIFLIGISRIYLGVHYPSDVLAGYVGGLCWFTSVLFIDKTLVFYKFFNQSKKTIKKRR